MVVAGNLRDKRRHLGVEGEALVLYKDAAHAAEIDRGEEVLEI